RQGQGRDRGIRGGAGGVGNRGVGLHFRPERCYTWQEMALDPPVPAEFLEPVDLIEHLYKLELYLGQVCRIAGISKMQLDYWTNKAQIPTKGRKQRIYDLDALETVMLIKQAKDKGLNLGAAIDATRRFREQRLIRPVEPVQEPPAP